MINFDEKKLCTLNEMLDEKYGKTGTELRDEFELRVKIWYLEELEKDKKKNIDIDAEVKYHLRQKKSDVLFVGFADLCYRFSQYGLSLNVASDSTKCFPDYRNIIEKGKNDKLSSDGFGLISDMFRFLGRKLLRVADDLDTAK